MDIERIYDIARGELYDTLIRRGKTPDLPILSLPRLNDRIWGLSRQKLTLIGARPSHGKSAFSLQMAFDLACQGKKVLYLSLEMSKKDMTERVFCYECGIDNQSLFRGEFAEMDVKIWKSFLKALKNKPLNMSETIGKTWSEIQEKIENLTVKPDVVILDYIQAIKNCGMMAKGELDEYIRNFREMAYRYNYAGVLCSQINRAGQDADDKAPKLHQLKGTGVLEEHADIIILLYWENRSEDMAVYPYQLEVAKNRNGRTGYFYLNWEPKYYRFSEVNKEEKPERQRKERADIHG